MLRKYGLLLCLMLSTGWFCLGASAEDLGSGAISGEAAVLMDAQTGQVLYEKNSREKKQPASITKILTGLLAMEYLEPEETVTASATAVDIPYWGSSAYLQLGERLTVDEAMYAMMLRSANDAANVLAEEIAGSLEEFAEVMNRRAQELGALDTHFSNANGLPDDDHVTTAYDMALITRQALDTPGFMDYFGAINYSMPATNQSGARVFTNTHRMLQKTYGVYNSEVIGGKTGYTVPAGYTLVTVAERDNRTLICVVLNSSSYYNDTQALLDYGFDEFYPYTFRFNPEEAAEISLWDGDWEAGRAYAQWPETAEVLLHSSVSPQDVVVDQLPNNLGFNEEIPGEAVLRLSGGHETLPEVLAAVPMMVEVQMFEPPVVPTMAELAISAKTDASGEMAYFLIVFLAVAGIAFGIILLNVYVARRRLAQKSRYRIYSIK